MNYIKAYLPLLFMLLSLSMAMAQHAGHSAGHRENESNFKSLGIPYGHLPPAGYYRIWYPGQPPGHQPKPASGRIARHQVPRGAWVLSWADESRGLLRVDEYDGRWAGRVSRAGEYLVRQGAKGYDRQNDRRWEDPENREVKVKKAKEQRTGQGRKRGNPQTAHKKD